MVFSSLSVLYAGVGLEHAEGGPASREMLLQLGQDGGRDRLRRK
jgi:hypothetical protein